MAETQTNNIPNNEIWYTSTDGNIIEPFIGGSSGGFGAEIASNIYENGKGIITFNGPITKIGTSSFRNISTLSTILIPSTVETLEEQAFNGCNFLTSINLHENIKEIKQLCFQNASRLTELSLPSSLSAIGYSAFQYCNGLTDVTIPDSVLTMGHGTFFSCEKLTSVIIGKGITSIGYDLFTACYKLKTVTIKAATVPSFGETIFRLDTELEAIYVPEGSVEAYKAATNLTEYADLIKAIPSTDKHKNFLDLAGLKTFWNNIKSTFISSADTKYFKLSTGSTKSVDIDSSKLAKGTSTDAGTKLATEGYLADKITENESEALTNDEILSLFNISGGGGK